MPARITLVLARLFARLTQNGSVPVDGFLWCEPGDSQQSANERTAESKQQRQRTAVANLDARQLHGFPLNGASFR